MRPREMLARLRDRFRRDDLQAELDEELRHHQALLRRDAGAAARTLGNITYYREEARDMWSLGLFDDLLHDLRYAWRVLRRDVGFTAAVVLTAGLGIGATTSVFGIVNAVILRPLPYANPERLVSVWTSPSGAPADRDATSLPDVRDWQQQATVFEGLAGFAFNRFDLSGPSGDTQARAVLGTGNLYELLGAKPELGRMPRSDEERLPVVTISDRLWRERFAAAPSAVGGTLRMNGTPYTIVGVMPPGFHFPTPDMDLWTTLYSITSSPAADGRNPWLNSRSLRGYRVVARLAPGVTIPQAERAMNVIEHRLAATYPDDDRGIDIHVQSARDDALAGIERGLWTVFGAAALILLLACVNVAHLLLARLSSRGRELAVRRALGAHRSRVVRQLVTESLLLGLLGGLAGIAVAWLATRLALRVSPADIPRLETVGIDGATLAFAVALSIVTGVLFGTAPALLGWSRGVHENLRTQGRGAAGGFHGDRTRALLTSVEVAFAVVLLVGAGLMLRSFAALTSADLGVRQSGVTITHLTMVGPRYRSDESKTRTLENVLAQLRALPGVQVAGASTSMPPTRIQEIEGFELTGKPPSEPGHEPLAIYIPATAGYIEALGIPLVGGRAFDDRDGAGAPPVALVSRELARRYFAGVDPVGRQIDVSGVTRTIVGVTGDAVYEGADAPVRPVIYVPFAQAPFAGVWIALRGAGDERSLAGPVRDAVHRVDPDLPAYAPRSFESIAAESVLEPRFHAWLLGTFGALALLLASIGIYGVIAYGVAQRRPEIGIRLALGAPTRSVVGLVLRGGKLPVVVGIAAGLGVAALASRLVAGLLYGIAPTDTMTFALVAVVLAIAGLAAGYVPARRAARVDPLTAIRGE
jgi:predicted permease